MTLIAGLGFAVAPAEALSGARVSAAAPSVQSMIVGSGGAVISQAASVTASATSVRVAGRSCAVAGGTPLATLAAVRRAGGPGFALRDYGHCGPSPRNSAELFVDALGGEANRGQNGWEYKVDGLAGGSGAADPSGPSGNGRLLRSGERVLWFWCRASGGGCERTLEVTPTSSTVSAGAQLTATVTGSDNEGHATPVPGSVVTLGSDFASTGPGGRATLIAPATRGRYTIAASRPGLVPSFPESIVVR